MKKILIATAFTIMAPGYSMEKNWTYERAHEEALPEVRELAFKSVEEAYEYLGSLPDDKLNNLLENMQNIINEAENNIPVLKKPDRSPIHWTISKLENERIEIEKQISESELQLAKEGNILLNMQKKYAEIDAEIKLKGGEFATNLANENSCPEKAEELKNKIGEYFIELGKLLALSKRNFDKETLLWKNMAELLGKIVGLEKLSYASPVMDFIVNFSDKFETYYFQCSNKSQMPVKRLIQLLKEDIERQNANLSSINESLAFHNSELGKFIGGLKRFT